MTVKTSSLRECKAPCGQIVDAEHYQEQEEGYRVADDWYYACNCRVIVHEYTDGSVLRKVFHHNGTLLVDDLDAEHHA